MAKNKRKIAEEALMEAILIRLDGFKLAAKDPPRFEKIEGGVKWILQFYLTGISVWSVFYMAAIHFLDLTKTINELLLDTELQDHFIKRPIGDMTTSTWRLMDKNSPLGSIVYQKFSSIEEVEDFADIFMQYIKECERNFWIRESDPRVQMEGFKKLHGHHLNPSLRDNIALWAAHGIQTNNNDEIIYGIKRGEAMLAKILSINPNYDGKEIEELFIGILRDKFKDIL
jgi:hypothetical protein